MEPKHLIDQLETYSNAIVGFAVLQGLAFAYYFGTSTLFNCLVKHVPYLAAGLIALFVFVGVASAFALRYLGRAMAALAGEHAAIVNRVTTGKIIVALVFNAVPLAITAKYSAAATGTVDCRAAVSPAKSP